MIITYDYPLKLPDKETSPEFPLLIKRFQFFFSTYRNHRIILVSVNIVLSCYEEPSTDLAVKVLARKRKALTSKICRLGLLRNVCTGRAWR